MSIALGTLPDWFSGIGTLGALGFAAWAVKTAVKANKKQDEQITYLAKAEEARVERERREQASQVAMWFDLAGTNSPAVFYSNRSGLPIYNVHILTKAPWGHTITQFVTLGPTSGEPRMLHQVIEDIENKSAGGMFRAGRGYGLDKKYLVPGRIEGWSDVAHKGVIQVGFAFKDADEIPWHWTPRGGLQQSGSMVLSALSKLAVQMGVDL